MRRIDPALAGTKKACALGTYVKRKSFPLTEFFQSIDQLKPVIAGAHSRLGAKEDDGTSLITVLSHVLDKDEELLAYVLDETNYEIDGDENRWRNVCMALAWTIVQEYDKAVEDGTWPI